MTDDNDAKLDVLLVDDEPLILMMAQSMLENAGYRVTAATSAEEALNWVDGGYRPAALVTDHSLPGLSGVGLADHLRDTIGLTSVLVVTGHSNQQLGWPMLGKPYAENDFVRRVDAITGRSEQ